jgi:hypothetical protein
MARYGDKAKPLAVGANSAGGFAVSEAAFLCRASHSATSNSDVVSDGRTRPLAESSAPPRNAWSQTCIVGGGRQSRRRPPTALLFELFEQAGLVVFDVDQCANCDLLLR